MSGEQQSDPVKASAEARASEVGRRMSAVGDNAPKWALRSKTVIGLLTLIAPQLLALFGVENSDKEVQDLAAGLSTVLGSVLVIWGRITARQSLSVLPQKPSEFVGSAMICGALASLALQGCATRVYGADGKPQLVMYGDATGLFFSGPGTRLTAQRMNHSTPTKAGVNGASGIITAAGAAAVTGGAW